MANDHYDVVIIGSGAGGGTLAWKLAPTGKRILLLERGDYLPAGDATTGTPRRCSCDSKYTTDRDVGRRQMATSSAPEQNYYVGGNTKFYGAALFRLAAAGLRRHHPPRWPLAGVAVGLRRLRAVVRDGRGPLRVHGAARRGPDRRPSQRHYP